jgi:hypothetical protein
MLLDFFGGSFSLLEIYFISFKKNIHLFIGGFMINPKFGLSLVHAFFGLLFYFQAIYYKKNDKVIFSLNKIESSDNINNLIK